MNCHCRREQTLGLLRETVWIINGKSLTRKVLKECRYCKRQTLKALSPMMSDLPKQLTICSYHVTYAFQTESTRYSCPNVKELLAQSRREI